ncbi:MAG TPA: G1 family glutamic endopeptidase [Terriglobales bacterium]|nr:G1 family glutamic endopeptidase [Terriglobales bacterium]
MLSKKLASLIVLAALPSFAQVQVRPDASPATEALAPRQHAPMRLHGYTPAGSVTSENWSGFAVTGSSFTSAKGSWIVPSVNCSVTPSTYSSFWVGIDGYSSSTVEQTGTDSDCSGRTARYYAWYEFYPAGSILISSVAVSPGNKMSASVTYSGSQFTVTITNVTTGKSFSKTGRVSGARRTSAEWIAEAPCCTGSGGILPLADFGTVDLGSDYTGVSGTNDATAGSISGPISTFGSNVFSITMVSSSGAQEAVPSALSSDGTSFDVVWKSE